MTINKPHDPELRAAIITEIGRRKAEYRKQRGWCMPSWQIENCITLACIVILVLGLYAMGAGGHSFWAMLLLLNINYPQTKRESRHDNQ